MSVIDRHRWQRASAHLDRALELPPQERAACLARLRAEEPETAADVEAMLESHRRLSAEGFLEGDAVIGHPEPALTGITVGAYTLVSPIGDGGMGSVWLAARSDGRFEGQVAVKLLNAALAGGGGEERFKREGTILARLTHPHIARLIDAGVSGTGQPYLVLESVEGRHIDDYCDAEHLSTEARIRLFLDVQAAVAHAHANLIVHRDLKPSNVLVTADGQVKLLDFGIAKLLEDDTRALASGIVTYESVHALTPKYAAPEQVLGGAITTATDVYSLGVLLYELLTGRHPSGLESRSPAEYVKAVTDGEPLRLHVVRGDLETILQKALQKDPSQRYSSVTGFADDLRRYLEHQPISARPDVFSYRAAKFIRRHRGALAAAAAVVALIAGLVGFYTLQVAAERDRAALEAAKASRISELLTNLLIGADPYRTPDPGGLTVRNLLDRGAERIATELGDQPEVQAEMFTVIGRVYQRLGNHGKALPLQQEALALSRRVYGPEHIRVAQSLNDLGILQRDMGYPLKAEPLLRDSLAMRRRLLGSGHKDVAVSLVELARAMEDSGRARDAEPLAREALAIRLKVLGDEHRDTATSKNELGIILMQRGDLAAAEPLFRDNVDTSTRLLGPDHPNTVAGKGNLAQVLTSLGRLGEAEALLREAVAAKKRVFGDSHPEYATTLSNLGVTVENEGRLAEAEAMFADAVRAGRALLPDDAPRVLIYATNLARVRIKRGAGAATEAELRRILAARERLYPTGNWRTAQTQGLLGAALLEQKRYADAERYLLAAHEGLQPIAGQEGRERADTRARLVSLYVATGRPAQAARYR